MRSCTSTFLPDELKIRKIFRMFRHLEKTSKSFHQIKQEERSALSSSSCQSPFKTELLLISCSLATLDIKGGKKSSWASIHPSGQSATCPYLLYSGYSSLVIDNIEILINRNPHSQLKIINHLRLMHKGLNHQIHQPLYQSFTLSPSRPTKRCSNRELLLLILLSSTLPSPTIIIPRNAFSWQLTVTILTRTSIILVIASKMLPSDHSTSWFFDPSSYNADTLIHPTIPRSYILDLSQLPSVL